MVTGSKLAITVLVMLAALMALIDITIVTVALNDIRASFGTPIDEIGWVVTGYMMANVVIIPLSGWFQRRFGYRRYFAASVVVFTLASALCGCAWNLPSLVIFRALQGLGGGAIIPTAQSILLARYPKSEHGMATALFGLGAVTGPLLGPTIGGYLIDWWSWKWCFLVNVPLGFAVAAMAMRFIQEPDFEPARGRVDVFGIVLLAVGMPSLQYVLEEGNREGWFESPTIAVLSAVAAVTLVTFVIHQLEIENPVVDLRVFKNRSYAAGTGVNLLIGLALFGGNYVFALFCGVVVHYAAIDIGRVFLASGVIQIVLMPIIGRTVAKVDARAYLMIGVLGVGASLWLNGYLTQVAGFGDLVMPMFVRSATLGFAFIPVTVLALSDLPDAQRGNAAGLFNLTRELGGSIGTAWLGLVIDGHTKIHRSYLSEFVNATNPLLQERSAAIAMTVGHETWTPVLTPEAALDRTVTLQALVLAFGDAFKLTAAVFAVAVVLVLLLKKPKPGVEAVGAH
jgi:DHA2 family multidrug resistance protein